MGQEITIENLIERKIENFLASHFSKEFPELIAVKDAAELLGVSESLIYTMVDKREVTGFPAVKIGKVVKINKAELIHWINAGGCPLEVEE